MADELNKFFLNTLERHGSGQRPDVLDYFPSYRDSNLYGVNGSASASSKFYVEKSEESKTVSGLPYVESHGMMGKTLGDDHVLLFEEINNIMISGSEEKHGTGNQLERHFSNHQPTGSEQSGREKKHEGGLQPERQFSNHQPRENGPQEYTNSGHLAGDAKDLVTSRSSRITNDLCKPSTANNELGTISFGGVRHAPHLYFSHPFQEIEKSENGNLDETKLSNSTTPKNSASSGSQSPDEKPDHERTSASNVGFRLCGNHVDPVTVSSTASVLALGLDAYPSETSYLANETSSYLESSDGSVRDANFRERDSADASGNNAEASNSLSDLSGDYDSHVQSLQRAQSILYGPVIPHSLHSFQYRNKSSWDSLRRSTHLKQSMFPLFTTAPGYYPVNPPLISGTFGMEEMQKPRGTGTYIPNTVCLFKPSDI